MLTGSPDDCRSPSPRTHSCRFDTPAKTFSKPSASRSAEPPTTEPAARNARSCGGVNVPLVATARTHWTICVLRSRIIGPTSVPPYSAICRRHPIAVWLRCVIGPARVLAINIRLICTGFRPVPVRAMAVRVLALCAWCLTGPTSLVRLSLDRRCPSPGGGQVGSLAAARDRLSGRGPGDLVAPQPGEQPAQRDRPDQCGTSLDSLSSVTPGARTAACCASRKACSTGFAVRERATS